MENSNQIEIIKKALDLETLIADLNSKLKKLSIEEHPSAPVPPERETIQREYPEIKSNRKFNWLLTCLPFIAVVIFTFIIPPIEYLFWPTLIWIPVSYFVIYKKRRLADVERIRNSKEYKAQCSALDDKFDKQQKTANEKYDAEKRIYETKTLPDYNKSLNEWTTQHNLKVDSIKTELEKAESSLVQLYATTKIIPLQYHSIEALQYIYNITSSSEYDIKEAIESFEKKKQRDLDVAKLREQQESNRLANEQADLIAEQNDLQAEQNEIARKARLEANVASAVGIVQRHNISKHLKGKK